MPIDDLELDDALADVLQEARRDEVPDVIAYRDFGHAWPRVREELIASLRAGTYRPRPARIVEVPKARLMTRPIAVLDPRDRVLYQAIMRRLATSIDRNLHEEVRSARLVRTRSPRLRIAKQSKAWADFQKRGRELCDDYADVCLLSTDITSYFEFIDLDRLARDLEAVPGIDAELARLLLLLLRGLASDASNLHGVPQGPEVSSVLGNLYLTPIDATLRSLGLRFLRFQDDIKVFASTQHDLRHALQQLMPVVRSLHLNLSTAKTKILQGDAVQEHFEDVRKDALQYGLQIGEPEIEDRLREFFDDAVSGTEVVERDVRFAVHRFERRNDDHAVPWILANLVDVPYLASLLVRYLSKHLPNRPLGIEERVRAYLSDPTQNLSPIVELQLVRMFANAEILEGATLDLLWTTLRDQNKHSGVRQFAARAIGRHARAGDAAILRAMFQASAEDALRRGLLIGLFEAGGAPTAFLRQVEGSDDYLRATAAYLRSVAFLPRP